MVLWLSCLGCGGAPVAPPSGPDAVAPVVVPRDPDPRPYVTRQPIRGLDAAAGAVLAWSHVTVARFERHSGERTWHQGPAEDDDGRPLSVHVAALAPSGDVVGWTTGEDVHVVHLAPNGTERARWTTPVARLGYPVQMWFSPDGAAVYVQGEDTFAGIRTADGTKLVVSGSDTDRLFRDGRVLTTRAHWRPSDGPRGWCGYDPGPSITGYSLFVDGAPTCGEGDCRGKPTHVGAGRFVREGPGRRSCITDLAGCWCTMPEFPYRHFVFGDTYTAGVDLRQIEVFDAEGQSRHTWVRGDAETLQGAYYPSRDSAFAGDVLVTRALSPDGAFEAYTPGQDEPVWRLEGSAFATDDAHIIVARERGWHVFRLADGAPIAGATGPLGPSGLVAAPDGTLGLIDGAGQVWTSRDGADWSPLAGCAVERPHRRWLAADDGRFIVGGESHVLLCDGTEGHQIDVERGSATRWVAGRLAFQRKVKRGTNWVSSSRDQGWLDPETGAETPWAAWSAPDHPGASSAYAGGVHDAAFEPDSDRVYTRGHGGWVHAWRTSRRRPLWTAKLTHRLHGIARAGGHVVVLDSEGLQVLDRNTGAIEWSVPLTPHAMGYPTGRVCRWALGGRDDRASGMAEPRDPGGGHPSGPARRPLCHRHLRGPHAVADHGSGAGAVRRYVRARPRRRSCAGTGSAPAPTEASRRCRPNGGGRGAHGAPARRPRGPHRCGRLRHLCGSGVGHGAVLGRPGA